MPTISQGQSTVNHPHVRQEEAVLAPTSGSEPSPKKRHPVAHSGVPSAPVYLTIKAKSVIPSQREAETRTVRLVYEPAKRLFDLALGTVLLVVAVPIILTAAAAIRAESAGSPFFVQTRLGKNGRTFKIVKLRGMYADARSRFPSYYDFSTRQDLDFCFHVEEDPRITRAGKFIRRTSIDELPNLWNVVLGDMSLVGPRPEIPEVMALYGHYREEYLSVKPGSPAFRNARDGTGSQNVKPSTLI
jgi:lipopolysaccharide/colanic/teichoic acid biosynthesis glycosyltransferase